MTTIDSLWLLVYVGLMIVIWAASGATVAIGVGTLLIPSVLGLFVATRS